MSIPLLFLTATALSCGYALLLGGAPERLGAATVAAGIVVSFATLPAEGHHFQSIEIDLLAIDLGMYAAFQQLALRADRFWTTWVAGFQLAILLVHLAVGLMGEHVPYAYSASMWVWPCLIVLCVAGGTWRHRRRIRHYGRDRSWSFADERQ